MNWYQYTKQQLAQELKTDLEKGLTPQEVSARLKQYGANILPEKPPESWLVIFLRQFQSPLIYILVACAAIIFYLRENTDAYIILAVLLINAVIGAVQEGRAGRMLQSLKKLSTAEASVLRGGEEVIVLEAEIVPGDILVLKEGQRAVADARVFFSHNLSTDESALTGESAAVHKKEGPLADENLPISSQHNMVFKGTAILGGDGLAVVVGTGINTEVGKISQTLLMPESEMPLQKNIKKLSKFIIYLVVAMSVFLFILGTQAGQSPRDMFALIVSLGVSVIPEGLPLVLTLILAHGVWRMSKKNALVKKMQAVEALGQANIIAVDKTGTLTKNEMVIKNLYTGKKIYSVTGNGYEPKGEAQFGGKNENQSADVKQSALVACLANKAGVQFVQDTGGYKVSGDPTEAAMLVFGEKLGFAKETEEKKYVEAAEIPFEYKNKFRAVFYEHEGKVFCAIAGAPEVILHHASHYVENGLTHAKTSADQKLFEEAVEEFAKKGLRVVAYGFKHLSKTHPLDNINELVFGGFWGIEDALRPEAAKSVSMAKEAGVKVVMITGDLKNTAKTIAVEAGIFSEGDIILTGTELAELSPGQLKEKLSKVSVFSRVTPEDKMKIIQGYKALGLTVAMTGDGVNDAPSLMAADLGVAMGKIGTEVAKEAADIVLLDDNLGSIVTAIKEGRVMYANIKKALQFLFSTSFGELLTVVFSLFLRIPVPVTAVQILWLNLITDPLSGAALALEKDEGDSFKNNRGRLSKFFIDRQMLIHIGLIGLTMALGALYIYHVYYLADAIKAQTMALTLLAMFQWYNSLNCRFRFKSVFNKRIFGNVYVWLAIGINLVFQFVAVSTPWFNHLLETKPLAFGEWVAVFVLAFSIILVDEIRKLIYRKAAKI
ncbi:MAG: cation-transporting P-type ATPase [Candidatus Doudnabacteria bacterium]|nr:cation-transporting P-type ATPase [Candidatus Doudnabacteria bacterium]